jgi:hypothetical protein
LALWGPFRSFVAKTKKQKQKTTKKRPEQKPTSLLLLLPHPTRTHLPSPVLNFITPILVGVPCVGRVVVSRTAEPPSFSPIPH